MSHYTIGAVWGVFRSWCSSRFGTRDEFEVNQLIRLSHRVLSTTFQSSGFEFDRWRRKDSCSRLFHGMRSGPLIFGIKAVHDTYWASIKTCFPGAFACTCSEGAGCTRYIQTFSCTLGALYSLYIHIFGHRSSYEHVWRITKFNVSFALVPRVIERFTGFC